MREREAWTERGCVRLSRGLGRRGVGSDHREIVATESLRAWFLHISNNGSRQGSQSDHYAVGDVSRCEWDIVSMARVEPVRATVGHYDRRHRCQSNLVSEVTVTSFTI